MCPYESRVSAGLVKPLNVCAGIYSNTLKFRTSLSLSDPSLVGRARELAASSRTAILLVIPDA